LHGIICMWSGALEDIPDGWALCDGTQGTPNIGNRFILGADPLYYPPGRKGGSYGHAHTASALPASPSLDTGDKFINSEPDGHYTEQTYEHNHTLNVETTYNFPPYYAMAFIMKL